MTYDALIRPAELNTHLDDANWRVIDCRFSLSDPDAGYRDYLLAHIPGAHYAHLDHDLASPIKASTGRHPLPSREVLQEKFSSWGIHASTQVVVYDANSGMMAARLWWLLRWMGHAAVALLDGGLQRWQREGHLVTAQPATHQPQRFALGAPLEHFITSEELLNLLGSPGHLLIDVRAAERYMAEVEPLDRVAGHIPGALNLPLQNNLAKDGSFLPQPQLKQLYEETLREHPAHRVSVMCGSGVTACHTILAMRLAGYPGASLYAGSWSEWITDPRRPVVTKDQP